MAPYTNIPLSPAELSYLHTSLSHTPPIRPDGRSPTQFRPLIAETEILPSTNGSARICFADGTEAIAGVKVEVEKTKTINGGEEIAGIGFSALSTGGGQDVEMDDELNGHEEKGEESWIELSIEIPGMRDDDALPVFLSAMLTEALLADGQLKDRLYINTRFHWRLYIDILLLSQPLSYPVPLLSLTTHLALLSTRIPALISEKEEDPLFNDDWQASTPLYSSNHAKPPITLLVMSIGTNVIFDPSHDELAVADAVLAISASQDLESSSPSPLRLVALRTIDPPSRLTAAGTPNNQCTGASVGAGPAAESLTAKSNNQGQAIWRSPRGGVRRSVMARIIKMVLEKGGVAQEVMDGLAAVET